MALDLAQLPTALRDHRLTVVEFGDWLARGYDTVNFIGQLNHHTAIPGPTTPSTAGAMVRGRSDLPGPLCNGHGGLDDRGRFVLYLTAGRRARHAGPGAAQVLNEFMRDEHVEKTAAQRGLVDSDAAHGNRSLFGWEWQHPGDASPWPDPLLEGIGRCNAVLADLAGWSPNRSKGHKHWTRRKIDPSWTGALPELTARYLEDDMALTEPDKQWIMQQLKAVNQNVGTVAGNQGATDSDPAHGSIGDVMRALASLTEEVRALRQSGTTGAAPTYEAQITLTPKSG